LAGAGVVHAKPPKPTLLEGKAETLESELASQLPPFVPVHALGEELRVGDAEFAVDRAGKHLRIAAAPGGEPKTRVRHGKVVALAWKEGGARRRVPLRFVRGDDGSWSYHAAETRRYRIEQVDFRLVDVDADGRFGEVGEDGYTSHESDLVLPLEREIVLGSERLRFEEIAPDGTRVRVVAVPVEGTRIQRDGLATLNRIRARNGLPYVELDEELSEHATSHAEYLRLNRWNGYSNPHGQVPRRKGATREGAASARRSGISRTSPSEAIESFWTTYYHRLGMLSPSTRRVGINAEPRGIAVVDASHGRTEGREERWTTTDPAFVPANGSTDIPTTATAELPREPVERLAGKGFCLTIYFRDTALDPQVEARLEVEKSKKRVEIPLLPAKRGGRRWIVGFVPARPLQANAWHRVTYSWEREGERVTRVVRFRTR
jgi:hypothetical protein